MAGVNCKATTKSGEPCRAWAGESGYCFMHDPASGKARAKARKMGGKRRAVGHGGDLAILPAEIRTTGDVLALLDYVTAETLVMANSLARGRLLVALAGAFIQAIKVGEFEDRITRLEEAVYGKS